MIDYQLDDLGIATLTWDMPGRSQNVINGGSCAALFAAIEKAATDSAVKGILMTSAKPDFVAGGDLEWLLSADGAEELFARTMALHRALRRTQVAGPVVQHHHLFRSHSPSLRSQIAVTECPWWTAPR